MFVDIMLSVGLNSGDLIQVELWFHLFWGWQDMHHIHSIIFMSGQTLLRQQNECNLWGDDIEGRACGS